MRKMLMLFASLLIVSSVFAEDYNPGADFHVDAAWNFNGDANFSDFTVIGLSRVTESEKIKFKERADMV